MTVKVKFDIQAKFKGHKLEGFDLTAKEAKDFIFENSTDD